MHGKAKELMFIMSPPSALCVSYVGKCSRMGGRGGIRKSHFGDTFFYRHR